MVLLGAAVASEPLAVLRAAETMQVIGYLNGSTELATGP